MLMRKAGHRSLQLWSISSGEILQMSASNQLISSCDKQRAMSSTSPNDAPTSFATRRSAVACPRKPASLPSGQVPLETRRPQGVDVKPSERLCSCRSLNTQAQTRRRARRQLQPARCEGEHCQPSRVLPKSHRSFGAVSQRSERTWSSTTSKCSNGSGSGWRAGGFLPRLPQRHKARRDQLQPGSSKTCQHFAQRLKVIWSATSLFVTSPLPENVACNCKSFFCPQNGSKSR